jgi:putative LysE/RhtB family amino acid efflux pump
MAVAVALIDVLYATLGLLGFAQLLGGGTVRLAFGLLSGAILVAIGARTAWIGFRARSGFETAREVVLPRRAFFTAAAATAFNPLTIALWTVSFPAAAPASAENAVGSAIAVLAGVALGTLTWYCGFAAAVALARKRVGDRLIAVVDVLTGCGLVGFGALLGYRAVEER